jgi:hypothetical protein
MTVLSRASSLDCLGLRLDVFLSFNRLNPNLRKTAPANLPPGPVLGRSGQLTFKITNTTKMAKNQRLGDWLRILFF